jgi:predicted small lipoprotein YifL
MATTSNAASARQTQSDSIEWLLQATSMSVWTHLRSMATAIIACTLLASCGQSGPLTLPEEAEITDAQSEEGPEDDEQEEDEQE